MENAILAKGALPPVSEECEADAAGPAEKEERAVRDRVRAPVLRRNLGLIVMAAAAVLGAAAGLRVFLSDNAGAALSDGFFGRIGGTFGEVFLRTAARSAVFLAAEMALGFFAFGDWLVWTLPFLFAEGAALRFALGEPLKMLPGVMICLTAVVFGAARSSGMSELLLRLSRGGTVYMENGSAGAYAMSFLSCLAGVVGGALLAGLTAAV